MDDERPGELLRQCWVHSHEEDTEGEQVFRPTSYALPPSRGRAGFELQGDKRYMEHAIAAGDGTEGYDGTWDVDDDGNVLVYEQGSAGLVRKLVVVALEEDRLVIKRPTS